MDSDISEVTYLMLTLFRQVYSTSRSNKPAGRLSVRTLVVTFRLSMHLPTFRHCRFSGRLSPASHRQDPYLFYGLVRVRGWHSACILLCWCTGGTMLSAETQFSAKDLIVKLRGGSTSDDAECVRILTEVAFEDSVGEATLSSFSRLGAKILAEEAYILDIYKRLDRRDSLPGSLVSV